MNGIKIIGILLIVTLTSTVYGQEKSVGFKFGITSSNVASDSRYIDNSSNLIGLTSGLIFRVKLQNKLVLVGDLLYSKKGYVYDFGKLRLGDELASDHNSSNDPGVNSDPELKFVYDYLSIPLKIGYSFGNKFTVTPSIGIVNSVLISAKSIFNGNEESLTSNVENYDFGLVGGVVISYPFSHTITMSITSDYQYGISDTSTSSFSSTKHRSFSSSIGLMYLLKK